jgi:multidrug transporter EmrE-like cation transporter
MPVTSLLLIVVCVLTETTAQLFYRMAGKHRDRYFKFVIPGVLIHSIEFAAWFMVLKSLPLGIALPLMGANYVTIALASRFLFGETVNARRWTGIVFIISGFVLVAMYST